MRGPPRPPSTIASSPRHARVGAIEESMRRPGATVLASPWIRPYSLGRPGAVVKSSIWSLRKNPAPGTQSRQPNRSLRVVVSATRLPSRSITETWVVSTGSLAVSAPGTSAAESVARPGSTASARRSRRAGASSRSGVAPVLAGSPSRKRSAKARRSASARRWARSAVSRSNERQPSRSSRPSDSAVSTPPEDGSGIAAKLHPKLSKRSGSRQTGR